MTDTIETKNNEAFYRECLYQNSLGESILLDGFTIEMDVKERDGTLIQSFSIGSGITVTNSALGAFSIQENNITAWPIGKHIADIVLTDTKGKSSETFYIKVIGGVTNV